MADLSDVTAALRQLVSGALYPGQVTPSGASPLAGVPVLVQSGWPDPASLQAMLAAGSAQVTVYPRPTERNVTRYARTWHVGDKQAKTFTLAQSGLDITVGGVQSSPYYRQNVCVFVNRKPYIYSTIAADDVNAIAAGLAALIVIDVPGTSAAGAVLTVPATIGALRVGTGAPVVQEVKRQEREFQLTVWAPSPVSRNAIAKPIDVAIALADWLTFADATSGRMIYRGSPYTDFDQKQGIYRRDFLVSVEYPTTNMDFAPEVVAVEADFFMSGTLAVLQTETPFDVVTEDGQQINLASPDLTLNF